MTNEVASAKYYCNNCQAYSNTALMRGNGWIELVLYLCYIVPGIIYSIWRRSGIPNVCSSCKKEGVVLSALVGDRAIIGAIRDEVDCPHCAEKILARAKVCKHCGQQVRV